MKKIIALVLLFPSLAFGQPASIEANGAAVVRSRTSDVILQCDDSSRAVKIPGAGGLITNGDFAMTSSTDVGIFGGTTPVTGITNGPLEIQANGAATNALKLVGYASAANDMPGLILARTKGTTAATNTIVAVDDVVGRIMFTGANGSSYTNGASISGLVDGTPGASNDMPMRIEFHTVPDGSGSRLRRWSIQSDGDLSGDATNGGDILLEKSGAALSIQEGTAASACMGAATPNGTTPVAVSTTCAVSGARVFYTRAGAVANMASISTTTAPSGTGFSFASTGASDTLASSVVWMIIKEAP